MCTRVRLEIVRMRQIISWNVINTIIIELGKFQVNTCKLTKFGVSGLV
jgi:hypothetical protein